MKHFLFPILVIGVQCLSAQTFTEITGGTEFYNASLSSLAFEDVNGDGYPDVLLTGRICSTHDIASISKLYLNDGQGHFTEKKDTPFEAIYRSSIAFSDVNDDDHPDLLISGRNSALEPVSKLYLNDGQGNFTEKLGTPFERVYNGSVAFSDVNGDGHPDALITGQIAANMPVAKLYLNDGQGNFNEKANTPLEPVTFSSVAFSDVNGDGHPDALITGENSVLTPVSKLYLNDGLGNFSENTNVPFVGVKDGSVAFSDVNADGHPDLLLTGGTETDPISTLYLNDGSGNFSEMPGVPFEGVEGGSIGFSDVNNDNSPDVFITGAHDTVYIAKLYLNDGLGNFIPWADSSFVGVSFSSIAFSDVNGDGSQDLLISGEEPSFMNYVPNKRTKLYINDGLGNFTEKQGALFEGVYTSYVAFSDVNGDEYPDLLITGTVKCPIERTSVKFYLNDGSGNFIEKKDFLPGCFLAGWFDDVEFSDVNGDGANDVIATCFGYQNQSLNIVTKLFLNDGLGNFTEAPGAQFQGGFLNSFAVADVNGDGYLDIFQLCLAIIGNQQTPSSKLYINDGQENFTERVSLSIIDLYDGEAAFFDANEDGAQDLIISGATINNVPQTKLYLNNGLGYFTEEINTPFENVASNSFAIDDVNGDGHQDILIAGWNGSYNITKLYFNDGLGHFSENTNTPFYGLYGTAELADVNGDGFPDALLNGGIWDTYLPSAKLYLNDGTGNFTEYLNSPFEPVTLSDAAFADVNQDGRQDVLIAGENIEGVFTSKLYVNHGTVSNQEPKSLDIHAEINAYPNPADQSVTLNLTENVYRVKVWDLLGRRILDTEAQGQYLLKTTHWKAGKYLIEVFPPSGTKQTLELIVQH